MAHHKARLLEFDNALNENPIDLKKLKKLCFSGTTDEGGRRGVCWRLLLNYLPLDRSQWESVLLKKRSQYMEFVREMVVEPAKLSKNNCDNRVEDHPLNPNPGSQWGSFFKDNEVLAQIDKDVRRLLPDINFFQRGTDFPCRGVVDEVGLDRLHQRVTNKTLTSASVTKRGIGLKKIETKKTTVIEDYEPLPQGAEAHWEVVQRILFVYAKLNPGQSYVQGMNEIIGPIYYTFANDPNTQFRAHAEADCFFCFTELMGEIGDYFIGSLDGSPSGIGTMMSRVMANLDQHDHQLWNRLRLQELRPEFFCFRWLTLLLSQEFKLPDVIRIWDSLFADPKRFSYLVQVCTAMLVLQRDALLNSDFGSNMKLLQSYPECDLSIILSRATELIEPVSNNANA